MKIIKTLAVLSILFSLVGCENWFSKAPKPPEDIKNYFLTFNGAGRPMSSALQSSIKNLDEVPAPNNFVCFQFEVVSLVPWKIKFIQTLDLSACHEVGGFQPGANIKFHNWIDDLYAWAKDAHQNWGQ